VPGIILSLPEGNDNLANSISGLCESWWLRELDGRDELVSQTLAYLLQRCVKPNAKVGSLSLFFQITFEITCKLCICIETIEIIESL
jgi:hypothetical protein